MLEQTYSFPYREVGMYDPLSRTRNHEYIYLLHNSKLCGKQWKASKYFKMQPIDKFSQDPDLSRCLVQILGFIQNGS